jgi:hypothetical protein
MNSIEETRARWERENPGWQTAIMGAAKRSRLELSLHSLFDQDDQDGPYLEYLTDDERAQYLSAVRSFIEAKTRRHAIIVKHNLIIEWGFPPPPEPEKSVRERLDKLGDICDAAHDTIWGLRQTVIDREQ